MRERTFGPYRIERRLATGGMAEVFVAHRSGPHGWSKRVALKCILPQLAKDPEFTSMFIDEARLAARLEHPGIVQVFDFGEIDGTLYLAMELVDGASVARMLRAAAVRHETVPVAAVVHVGIETSRALAYAHHARGDKGERLEVVHRDVSPANLLISRRGQPKLSDFGIARFAEAAHRTDEGHVRGKLGYMSPEQVSGSKVDAKTDVFTLATVMAEMLTGEPLFGQGTELEVLLRIRNADISALRKFEGGRFDAGRVEGGKLEGGQAKRAIPSDLLRLLTSALARRPQDRPEASTFADELDKLARRRRFHGEGELELARTLFRFELATHQPEDADAREPGARPTALVDTGDVRKVPTAQIDRRPGTDELLARLALEPHSTWEVKDGDRVMGPLAFPTLVQKILSGEVSVHASIRKDKGPPVPGTEVPELQRYIGSKALAFDTDELHKATATGRLEDGSLLALTCRLAKERRTGLVSLRDLVVGTGGKGTIQRRKKVYFVDGRPDFVSSNDPGELLGEHLVRTGVCVRMEVDMALAMLPRFGGRLGDALVRMGILTPAQLYSAIASQVRTRYLEAFRWRTGGWCYVPDLKADEETVPLREGVPDLLRAAAEAADLGVVTGALRPLRDRMLSPGLAPPFPMSVYGARASWQEVVGSVHGGTTLSGTVTQHTQGGRRDPEDVYRAIWFGLSTELLRAA